MRRCRPARRTPRRNRRGSAGGRRRTRDSARFEHGDAGTMPLIDSRSMTARPGMALSCWVHERGQCTHRVLRVPPASGAREDARWQQAGTSSAEDLLPCLRARSRRPPCVASRCHGIGGRGGRWLEGSPTNRRRYALMASARRARNEAGSAGVSQVGARIIPGSGRASCTGVRRRALGRQR